TFVCVRFEPKLKQFYERLRANGKAFKVAINACMRKLLTILNAIIRDGSQWDAHAL
ncbi:IS110 family transposase, partial [Avibacterium avium]